MDKLVRISTFDSVNIEFNRPIYHIHSELHQRKPEHVSIFLLTTHMFRVDAKSLSSDVGQLNHC